MGKRLYYLLPKTFVNKALRTIIPRKNFLENILEQIPRKLVSRNLVKNILDEAVTQEFYLKVLDDKDNRRRVCSINAKYEENIGLIAWYQDIFGELRWT